MLKIAVFDTGWGGELFADYIESRLKTVEVIRIIDWKSAPYEGKRRASICNKMEAALMPYIGKVDLIVIASYLATVVGLAYLKRRWPMQQFIGFEPKLRSLLPNGTIKRVMTLATAQVRNSTGYEMDMMWLLLRGAKIIEPDCKNWARWVDDGDLDEELLRMDLDYQASECGLDGQDLAGDWHVDVVLIYCTNLVEIREKIEKVLGKQVMVVDDFERVFRRVCLELGLLGVDGERGNKFFKQRRKLKCGFREEMVGRGRDGS